MADAAIEALTKWCPTCSANKPLTEFHKDRSRAGGLAGACKSCKRQAVRDWYKQNKKCVQKIIKEIPKEKACTKCGVTKPIEAFGVRKRGRYGRNPRCKNCRVEEQKTWSKAHPECRKQYYRINREKICESMKSYAESVTRWRERNKPMVLNYRLSYRQRLRAQVIEAYGGKCVCCGETTQEFLSIDHIQNDGAAHRREIGGSGVNVYAWLRKNNFPKDRFQLLCHNCNLAKGFYGMCPHARALETKGAA